MEKEQIIARAHERDEGANWNYISIFKQTGVGTRGYVVAHEKPNNSANLVISDISYPNIYRFDFKP